MDEYARAHTSSSAQPAACSHGRGMLVGHTHHTHSCLHPDSHFNTSKQNTSTRSHTVSFAHSGPHTFVDTLSLYIHAVLTAVTEKDPKLMFYMDLEFQNGMVLV